MSLPEPYGDWLQTLCGGPLPSERRATCDDCVMCGPEVVGGNHFDPRSKCCTYVPRIPNFMMGRILADRSLEEGRQTILDRLDVGDGISPLGLEVSEADQAAYDAIVDADGFGRSGALRCPHYLSDGRCGVWRHRNGICGTWFCRHENGAHGQRFWEAVQLMFTELERAVGYWIARRIRWPEGVEDAFEADKKLYACDWGRWQDDPEGFYAACAEQFARLDWAQVRRIGDGRFDRLCDEVERCYAALRGPLPNRLTVADDLEEHPRATEPIVDLLAYSATDPIPVGADLAQALSAFDGRRVGEVITELQAQGLDIDVDLVSQLRAFDVLLPSEENG
jgi:hypothetical protein